MARSPTGQRILVADDDDLVAQSLADFLERDGYQVEIAASPEEARRKLRTGRFDLALIDVRLRDNNDPLDTSGVWVAHSVAPTTPKILMTQFDEPRFLQRVLDHLTEELPRSDSEPMSIWKVLLTRLFPREQRYEVLSRAIRQAIRLGEQVGGWQKRAQYLLEELEQDHAERRRQASWTYRLSVLIGLVGIGFIGLAFVIASESETPSTWSMFTGIGGICLNICSGVLWKISQEANRRMDESSAQIRELFDRLLDMDVERGSPVPDDPNDREGT